MIISRWGQLYQSGAKVISKWGKILFQSGAVISKWGNYFKVGHKN